MYIVTSNSGGFSKEPAIIKNQKKIGIREIAEKANVSIGTVDRVVHNRGEVSPATKEKILRIIRKWNYEPNLMARSLASKKHYTIASLLPFHTDDNTYWRAPLEGLEKAENEIHDYGVTIRRFFFNLHDKESFKKKADQLLELSPDAILLAPIFYEESRIFLRKCDSRAIPYGFIDSNMKGQKNISYIGQDSFQSGYLAARLLSMGASGSARFLVIHIAMETGNMNHLKQRENGFKTWFLDHDPSGDIAIETLVLPGSGNGSSDRLLPGIFRPKTDGVFLTSNACKVASYLNQKNLDHIRVIGYDLTEENLRFLKSGTIDFLICQKPGKQGYYGILSLFNHLVHKKPGKTQNYVPIDIITRDNYSYYLEFE